MIELYEGIAETGVPVVGGDTTAAPCVVISVTALGRSERVPGRAGARPGDLLVVTGALGAAGAAFRGRRYARPPLRLAEGRRLAASAPRCSTSPTGSRWTPLTSRDVPACACVIDLDRVAARARRDGRRPRLRRGLRAARRRSGRRRLTGDRPGRGGRGRRRCSPTACRSSSRAGSTSAASEVALERLARSASSGVRRRRSRAARRRRTGSRSAGRARS